MVLCNFLKQKAKEFVLNENLSSQERSERFELFCIIYDAFPEIEKAIFEDFKNRLISEIKRIDENLEVKYSNDEYESFDIFRKEWKIEKPRFLIFYFQIQNSIWWGYDILFMIHTSQDIREKLLQNSQFCKIVEEIHSNLKEKFLLENEKGLENWQKEFKEWGGILFGFIKEPATGWDPIIGRQEQRLNRRSFYQKFLKDPEKIVNKYIDKFEKIYKLTKDKLTKDKINELVKVL